MNKIAVITVSYNNAAGLERTMTSVLEQDYPEFEYIVVDGGSEDGSRALLQRQWQRPFRWQSEPDHGVYDAMNKAIIMSQAEYLLFINSGDLLYSSTTLRKASGYLTKGYDIVYGNLIISDKGKKSKGYMPDVMDLRQMMRDTLWHPVSFIRAGLFKEYGLFSLDYRICSDYDFFFRMIVKENVSTLHIDQFIAVFETNGMSSDLQNVPLILSEKEKIRNTYLSKEQLAAFHESVNQQKPEKKHFFRGWFR